MPRSNRADALTQWRHALVARSYWINTARFYAGFANPNEVNGLLDGIEDSLDGGRHPLQARVALWFLLGDGVFASRVRAQKQAAALLADDLSVRLMSANRVTFTALQFDRGGAELASLLKESIETTPSSRVSLERAGLLNAVAVDRIEFEEWWHPRMAEAAGTPLESVWLRLGAAYGEEARIPADISERLSLSSPIACRSLLALRADPAPDSAQGEALLNAVLDGYCADASVTSGGPAADLQRVLRPQNFVALTWAAIPRNAKSIVLPRESEDARRTAFNRLFSSNRGYTRLQQVSMPRYAKTGTTAAWQDSARELCSIHGPCWLAAEIAIIGAAAQDLTTGGGITLKGDPMGPDVDYGTLVAATRTNRASAQWWQEQHAAHPDSLSRRTWALALLAVADESVLLENIQNLDDTLLATSDADFRVLADASTRLAITGVARRLTSNVLLPATAHSPRTLVVVSQHCSKISDLDALERLSDDHLMSMARLGPVAWTAVRAITARMLTAPNDTLLDGLRACGPEAAIAVPSNESGPGSVFVDAILRSPSEYPLGWLLAAENWRSRGNPEVALADVAKKEGWVPDL